MILYHSIKYDILCMSLNLTPFSHPVFREPPKPCLRTSQMRCVCLHNSETTKATHMVGTVPRHNAELENTSRKF